MASETDLQATARRVIDTVLDEATDLPEGTDRATTVLLVTPFVVAALHVSPQACSTPELMFTAGPLRDAARAGWHAALGQTAAMEASRDSARGVGGPHAPQ